MPRNSSADLRWRAMWMVQAVGMTKRYAFYSHLSDSYPLFLSVESRRVAAEQRQRFLKWLYYRELNVAAQLSLKGTWISTDVLYEENLQLQHNILKFSFIFFSGLCLFLHSAGLCCCFVAFLFCVIPEF